MVASAAVTLAKILELATPHGPARVYLTETERASGRVVLGHGAGGGVEAPDLTAAAEAAHAMALPWRSSSSPTGWRVDARRPRPASSTQPGWR